MAKKKGRKSRRQRSRQAPVEKRSPRSESPSPAKEEPVIQASPRPKRKALSGSQKFVDFVHEYAYVYYDLRKMFTLAFVMLVLLILVNVVLTHFVVVGG